VVTNGGQPTAECPGTRWEPAAAPGYLCVYENSRSNLGASQVFSPAVGEPGAERYGFMLRAESAAAGTTYLSGTWAVTAP
jgi:hypothetical protein